MLRAHPSSPREHLGGSCPQGREERRLEATAGQWLTKELGIWGMSRSLEATEVWLWDQWRWGGGHCTPSQQ